MKLSVCLMLALVTAASADQGFYQPQRAEASPEIYYNYDNNNDYQQPTGQGFLDKQFNRRQGLGSISGGLLGTLRTVGIGGPILLVIVAAVGLALAGALYYVATELYSSGRGLTSDEWEVDHSVWMDQLQKDFEDSWSE